jgi:alpha-aminoadipate carrier protein LysW
MIRCKGCNAEIDAEEDELDEGDTITCDECGADQRVVSIDPFDLELVDEEEEDEEEGDLDEDEDEEFPK